MDYQGFITTVQDKAHVPGDLAERAACATLHTLGQRISPGEVEDLAERLPAPLRQCVEPDGPPERFNLDEFIRRVDLQLHDDRPTVEGTVKAVFAALRSAVGPDEFADMRSQLPKDFDPLLDQAIAEASPSERERLAGMGTLSYDELLDRIAQEAGLDRQGGRRAAEAVLEALSTRLSEGQVDDLELLLPAELHPAMERGRARGGGRAIPMSLDEFVEGIARLEGVTKGEATEHARAVFQALREAVGEKEWHDTTSQLPGEYRVLWRRG
jgi:uncharacterized protein (DUF2267 family)